jgi:hypothetical protein
MKLPSILWDRNSTEAPLKQLVRLVDQKQSQGRPSIPSHARVKPVFRDSTANELTSAIIAFFNSQGGLAERINNMGRQVNRKGSTIWVYGTGTNGTADIGVCFQGISLKVEVKAGTDRQSDAQKEYQKRIESAGGIYIIARSFDGFIHEFFRAMEGRLS